MGKKPGLTTLAFSFCLRGLGGMVGIWHVKFNEAFFLKSCFWDFPSGCNSSNVNLQFRPENGGYFQRQFYP
jgi:hypothetical protein